MQTQTIVSETSAETSGSDSIDFFTTQCKNLSLGLRQ